MSEQNKIPDEYSQQINTLNNRILAVNMAQTDLVKDLSTVLKLFIDDRIKLLAQINELKKQITPEPIKKTK